MNNLKNYLKNIKASFTILFLSGISNAIFFKIANLEDHRIWPIVLMFVSPMILIPILEALFLKKKKAKAND